MQIICTYTVAVSGRNSPLEFMQSRQKPVKFLIVPSPLSCWDNIRIHLLGLITEAWKKRLKSGRISILSLALLINKNWQELNWLAHTSGITEIKNVLGWEEGFLLEGFWVENSTCMRTASKLTKPQCHLSSTFRMKEGTGGCLSPWKTCFAFLWGERTERILGKWR